MGKSRKSLTNFPSIFMLSVMINSLLGVPQLIALLFFLMMGNLIIIDVQPVANITAWVVEYNTIKE